MQRCAIRPRGGGLCCPTRRSDVLLQHVELANDASEATTSAENASEATTSAENNAADPAAVDVSAHGAIPFLMALDDRLEQALAAGLIVLIAASYLRDDSVSRLDRHQDLLEHQHTLLAEKTLFDQSLEEKLHHVSSVEAEPVCPKIRLVHNVLTAKHHTGIQAVQQAVLVQ